MEQVESVQGNISVSSQQRRMADMAHGKGRTGGDEGAWVGLVEKAFSMGSPQERYQSTNLLGNFYKSHPNPSCSIIAGP